MGECTMPKSLDERSCVAFQRSSPACFVPSALSFSGKRRRWRSRVTTRLPTSPKNSRWLAIHSISTSGMALFTGLLRPSISHCSRPSLIAIYRNTRIGAASVAKGEKVYGNPEWWLVVDGRLYCSEADRSRADEQRIRWPWRTRPIRTGRVSTAARPAGAGLHACDARHAIALKVRPPLDLPADGPGARGFEA